MTPTSLANQRRRQSPLVYLLSIGVLVGVIVLLMWMVGSWLSGVAEHKPIGASAVDIGQQGHLQSSNGGIIPFARTADDMRASMANSQVLDSLVRAGRLGTASSGARVLVTDGDWLSMYVHLSEVRILDGPQAGSSGWVLSVDLAP